MKEKEINSLIKLKSYKKPNQYIQKIFDLLYRKNENNYLYKRKHINETIYSYDTVKKEFYLTMPKQFNSPISNKVDTTLNAETPKKRVNNCFSSDDIKKLPSISLINKIKIIYPKMKSIVKKKRSNYFDRFTLYNKKYIYENHKQLNINQESYKKEKTVKYLQRIVNETHKLNQIKDNLLENNQIYLNN